MISPEELKSIEVRIQAQSDRRSRAAGAIAQIKEGWKAEYGTDDEAEIRKILTDSQAELTALEARIQSEIAEIRAILVQAESIA